MKMLPMKLISAGRRLYGLLSGSLLLVPGLAVGEAAPAPLELRTPAGVVFTIGTEGLSRVTVGDLVVAQGTFSARNVDKLFDVGTGEVRVAPVDEKRLDILSPTAVRVTHVAPDATLTYTYSVAGNDLTVQLGIANRHATATLGAVGLRGLTVTHGADAALAARGWGDDYLGHPSNRRYVFSPTSEGRVGARECLLLDTRFGLAISPAVVEGAAPPVTFLTNWHNDYGRNTTRGVPEFFVQGEVAPGGARVLAMTLRVMPRGATWVALLEPYRAYWRAVRVRQADHEAASETIKQMTAAGAAAGAIETVRQSEMFARLLQERQSAAQRDSLGPLASLLPRVEIGWYPSRSSLVAHVGLGRLEERFPRCLPVLALRVEDAAGKPIATGRFPLPEAHGGRFELTLPALAEGDYRAIATIDGYDQPWEKPFTWKRFPWAGNTLGRTEKVLPPFTPVTVRGQQLSVVSRVHTVDGLGLWSSVSALDRELLAAPMRLVVNGDQPVVGKGKFTRTTETAAVYEGQASLPAVTVRTRATTEVDGCMRVELTLEPGGQGSGVRVQEASLTLTPDARQPAEALAKAGTLNSLWLDIPLKDALAPLWHVSTSGLRANPAGAAPAGEGVVWTSQQGWSDGRPRGDGYLLTNFKPYLWLGADERGLAWFADNDKGWVLDLVDDKGQVRPPDRQPPQQELIRENGQLIMRLHLVQRPVTLTAPRTIVFGLMATPAKPLPAAWRTWTPTVGYPGHRSMLFSMQYWGSDTHYANRYPRNRDLSVLDVIAAVRRGDPVDVEAFLKGYRARNDKPGLPPLNDETLVRDLIAGGNWFNTAKYRDRTSLAATYYEELLGCNPRHEEFQVYRDEWTGSFGRHNAISGMVPSYRDFGVWYAREFTKRGFGLYYDNAFPERTHDPLTSDAYPLREADPRIAGAPGRALQPACRVWALRDYLKRLWAVTRTDGSPDFQVITYTHMTNTDIAPWLSWADAILDLEYPYTTQPLQARFSAAALRAASHGRRSGSVPTALAQVGAETAAAASALDRTRFGVLMVHEIRPWPQSGGGVSAVGTAQALYRHVLQFGYGAADCRVWNYWDEASPVRVSDPQAKTLLLKRGDALLLLVCTWNKEPATVTVTVDAKALGLTPTAARDLERPEAEALPVQQGALTLPLDGYAVRLLRLQ
jgi:hypothetical protein